MCLFFPIFITLSRSALCKLELFHSFLSLVSSTDASALPDSLRYHNRGAYIISQLLPVKRKSSHSIVFINRISGQTKPQILYLGLCMRDELCLKRKKKKGVSDCGNAQLTNSSISSSTWINCSFGKEAAASNQMWMSIIRLYIRRRTDLHTYLDYKEASEAYQQAWQLLRNQAFPLWPRSDRDLLLFKWNPI